MALTAKQMEVLGKLAAGPNSAYGMQASLGTLEALSTRRLVMAVGVGHMAFPRSGTWQITTLGRAALVGGV